MNTPKAYARHGSVDFNNLLHQTLIQLAQEVNNALSKNVLALLLGGGYGRGEGGVRIDLQGKEQPYNDLDLVLILKKKESFWYHLTTEKKIALSEISEKYEQKLGIHVDFSHPLTLKEVKKWPHWLMWHDLFHGHHILIGPQDILPTPHWRREPLPAIEATRLLLNRGAGLLWASCILKGIEKKEDPDFIRRNYYKCALSLGDALLISYKKFTTSYQGRDLRLTELLKEQPLLKQFGLTTLYPQALKFKFSPHELNECSFNEEKLQELAYLWGEIFLHIESRRTKKNWKSLEEYVHWKGIRQKEQHQLAKLPRNLIRNFQLNKLSWRYPREILYRQLPGLLKILPQISPEPEKKIQFLKIWRKFNC